MKSNTQNITSRQITTLQKSFLRFLGVFFFILSIKFSIFSQSPTVTTRFANPIFNCNNEYCVDVQFKANVPNVRLFGINFRFFYPDSTLELIGFNNFSPGYGILNSPIITSLPNTAAVLFSFNSPPEWVNGNIELMDPNIITYLDTANWTKLFSVCFHIDDPNPNPQSFCVPLVLDLEQDPENGGYLPGDDGLIITIVDPQNSSQTYPADENVIQFNWMYVGDGIVPPFGIPQNNNCITLTPDCNPYITCPGNRIVQCAESTDPANTGFATSTDICDGDPVTVYNDVISSGSCSQGYSILRRWIVTNACNKSDTCFQTILVVDTIPPAITCPADITVFCPANPTFATPVMNDVCDPNPILSFTDMNVFNGCAASHVITRTWTATDHCGNASTCTSKITYKDETAPAMTCPVNVTLNCQDDNSSANTGAATATDICSSAVVTQSQTSTRSADPEDCSHYTYTINRLWIATDACGNSSTCIQTISVHDVTPPVITCPSNLTILFSENTLPGNTGNATAIDNCNPAISPTYTDITSPQTCSPVHRIFRTWKAMDACGNSTTCQQTITINDKGTICGSVHDDLGQAMAGIEIRLEADINGNQAFDAGDTLIATVFSAAGTGQFCFSNVIPCNYVLVEIQPASYGNLSDFDSTPDPDGDDSSDGPDNQIPVVLSPGENDLDNNFIDIICPTQLPVISPDTICANGSVVFQTSNIPLGTLTYSWDFGSGSTPGTAIGLGPNTVSYVTTTNNQVNGAVVSMSIAKTGCSTLTGQVSHVIVNPYAVPAFVA
ncbi:MAG: hypothetical protein ABJC12_09130 [Saprospiraceae bacterium]